MAKIKESMALTREILKIPKDYLVSNEFRPSHLMPVIQAHSDDYITSMVLLVFKLVCPIFEILSQVVIPAFCA
jgi:hypothetical protein